MLCRFRDSRVGYSIKKISIVISSSTNTFSKNKHIIYIELSVTNQFRKLCHMNIDSLSQQNPGEKCVYIYDHRVWQIHKTLQIDDRSRDLPTKTLGTFLFNLCINSVDSERVLKLVKVT